jgi:transcription factor STE12
LEIEENEFGSLEDDSPASDSNNFIPPNVVNMATVTSMPASITLQTSMPTMVAPQMITPEFMQQHI